MKAICSPSSASSFFSPVTLDPAGTQVPAPALSLGFLPSIVEKPVSAGNRAIADLYYYARATRDKAEVLEDVILVILGASGLAGTALTLL